MKKTKTIIAAVLAVAICLAGTACSNAAQTSGSAEVSSESTGISLILKDTVYSNDKGSIDATWQNSSDKEITYGQSFSIEHQTDGEWVEYKPTSELFFDDIGYMLKAGQSKEYTYDLSKYDFTEPGSYRIATIYLVEADGSKKPQRTYDDYNLYAQFTVE